MAHYQVTAASLTPTRPAPAAPMRRGNDIQNVLSSSGYASSFSVGTSSPSGSSYASSYSGIGGSPNRNSDMVSSSHIVRSGLVAIKEDGIVSWLWRPKWLVLKEQTLSIHKNEVSTLLRYSFCLRVGMLRCSFGAGQLFSINRWPYPFRLFCQVRLSTPCVLAARYPLLLDATFSCSPPYGVHVLLLHLMALCSHSLPLNLLSMGLVMYIFPDGG